MNNKKKIPWYLNSNTLRVIFVLVFVTTIVTMIALSNPVVKAQSSSGVDCVQLYINSFMVYQTDACTLPTETPTATVTETGTVAPTETSFPTATNTLEPTVTNTLVPSPTNTAVPSTQTPAPNPIGWFAVNSNNLYLFDQIPEEYLALVRNMQITFSDASVGDNIKDGLACLGWNTSINPVPNNCIRPDAFTAGMTGRVPSTLFSKNNITYLYEPDVATFITRDHSQSDIYGYMPNYLFVDFGDADDICYGVSGCSGYLSALANLESLFNGKMVYYTTSLARTVGSVHSFNVNSAIRNFAFQRQKVLVDVAEIESHRPDGSNCNLGGYPIICEQYTTEIKGGHLGSVSAGKIRIAKAMWIAFAYVAGWRPDGTPLPTYTPTITLEPTLTPVATTTLTPTVTQTGTLVPTVMPTNTPFSTFTPRPTFTSLPPTSTPTVNPYPYPLP